MFSPQKTQRADLTESSSGLPEPNSLLETDPERAGARRFRGEGYGHGNKEEGDCKQSAGSDCQYLHSVSSFHNLTLASLPAVVMLVHQRTCQGSHMSATGRGIRFCAGRHHKGQSEAGSIRVLYKLACQTTPVIRHSAVPK